MTLHDVRAFQQIMVQAYVRNLMVFATFPLLVAQEMRRDRAGRSGPGPASTSRTGSVVSIARGVSFKSLRDREDRTVAGAVLSYGAFARRVKRKMLGMTSSSAGNSAARSKQ